MPIRPRPSLWRPMLPLAALLLGLGALLWWLPSVDQLGPALVAEPLAPCRTADGTRFRRLRGLHTGLRFENVLQPENRYQYLTNGAGLAVGDYDRDGLPDLYLCSQDGPNRLFRQVSPLRFQDVTERAGDVGGGQAWHTGATFADVDGDGWLDLYVCCMEASNKLYRNRGDGSFEECAARFGLDFAGATMMAAFCDYDRDGDLDVYLLTNRALHPDFHTVPEVVRGLRPPPETARSVAQMMPDPTAQMSRDPVTGALVVPAVWREHYFVHLGKGYIGGQSDRLLRNDGSIFRDATAGAGMGDHGMGLGVVWWDHDGDGWPDLYIANDLESPDTLWRNGRDGTFRDVTREVLPHTAYYGMGVDAGDLDNDGLMDLLVADMSATTHYKAKILMGDMTDKRDFLRLSRPPQVMRNAMYRNTGTGRFQEIAVMAGTASTDWTWSVLFGDLDNDGFQDLFVTNGIARFDQDPDVELRKKALWQADRQQEAIALIQSIPAVAERNQALKNLGGLRFQRIAPEWGLDHEGVSHGAALVDLDRDGDLDVVALHWNEEVGLYENVGPRGHAVLIELRGRGRNPYGVGARVEVRQGSDTLVREAFPARGYLSGQDPVLHFGLGDRARLEVLTVRWPSGAVQEFRDLQADQRYTVREPAAGGDRTSAPPPPPPTLLEPMRDGPAFVHREQDLGEFEYQREPLLPHGLSRLGPGVAVGDLNGDLRDDLWIGGAAGQPGSLLLASADGWRPVPRGPWEQDRECEDLGAVLLDFDGDGDLDLYVVSGGVEAPAGDERLRDRLYRNDGNGSFTRAPAGTLPDLAESGSSVCACDFDRDSDLDLMVGGRIVPGSFPDAPPSRLLRNDGGRFTDVTADLAPALLTAGMVTGATWTDVDGDGWLDLVVAAHWAPIRILRNDGGQRLVDATATAGLADCLGWWNGVLALDADGDGDTDLIAANFGRNTKYQADPQHPTAIYFADFDDNGTRDLIEAKYEGDRLLPVRGRSCSSAAMPHLADKFPTYRAFAGSLLEQIYPEDQLESAGVVKANCLDSVLLRNDGSGRFTVEPLPWLVQAAPTFGLAALEADGMPGLEVAGAQNFFSPEPETGAMDGGLGFLLAGATGWLEPRRSGVVAPGDGKGCATGDLDSDGAPDLLMTFSDGPVRTFRNHIAPHDLLAVRLRGGTGNPTAVGARVTAVGEDGARQVQEVTAGAGYLSQSSATLWFVRRPAPIVGLQVRWPDGRVARHEVAADQTSTVLDLPR